MKVNEVWKGDKRWDRQENCDIPLIFKPYKKKLKGESVIAIFYKERAKNYAVREKV